MSIPASKIYLFHSEQRAVPSDSEIDENAILTIVHCRQRGMAKPRFKKLLSHADQDVKTKGQSVEEELAQVAAVVTK